MKDIRVEDPECEAFRATKKDWRKGFQEKVLQLERNLRLQRPKNLEPGEPQNSGGFGTTKQRCRRCRKTHTGGLPHANVMELYYAHDARVHQLH